MFEKNGFPVCKQCKGKVDMFLPRPGFAKAKKFCSKECKDKFKRIKND